MAKSSKSSKESSLPYDPPFRYTRPERDLQSIFGAQIGNPPILPVRKEAADKSAKRAKPAPVKAGKVTARKAAAPKLAPKPKQSTKAGAAKAAQKPKKATGKR